MRGDHDCIYNDSLLWWKAEALLGSLGKGTPTTQLLVASAVPIPVPREIAEEHMEKAKAELAAFMEGTK